MKKGVFILLQKLKAEIMHSRSEVLSQLHVSNQVICWGIKPTDTAFGPLAIIDHAVMKKGLTIKMHEHVNDEILSYISTGVTHHKDSAGFEAPIARGKLMMMNAGESFWHEEKVKEDEVEMLQIFVRPNETNLLQKFNFMRNQ